MKLKIEPAPSVEVAHLLRKLADKAEIDHMFDEAGDHVAVMDSNGNRVGEARVSR